MSFFVAAGLVVFPAAGLAGTITGYVVDACLGKTISGAIVSVTGGGSTTTNSSGYYFLNVMSTPVFATASKSGYDPQTKDAKVLPVGTTQLNFELCPAGVTVSPPNATTYAAQNITRTSATLRGYVQTMLCGGTGGARYTAYHFQYGTSPSYGSQTPMDFIDATGTVSENITGLTPNTPYYFRIVAENCGGPKSGTGLTFTTLGAPLATTDPAEEVKVTSALARGTVNPNGLATAYKFQYGLTASYGTDTSSFSAGAGNDPVAVSTMLTDLLPATLYHFRVVATNTEGSEHGDDRTFTSEAVPDYRFQRIWPTLQQPHYFGPGGNVSVNASGKVYLADTEGHRIMVFTLNGQLITTWGGLGSGPGQFNFPQGIAVDSSRGRVYVADMVNRRIQVFTEWGQYLDQWGSEGSGNGQFNWALVDSHIGMAVDDSTGYVYVVDQGNDRIQVFEPSGNYLTQWGGTGSGNGFFVDPIGIAINHKTGRVYVSDQGNFRIQSFDLQGGYVTKWGSYGAGDNQFKYIYGLSLDFAGNVYVAERSNATSDAVPNRIKVYTGNGVYLRQWGSLGREDGQFYGTNDVAVHGTSGMVFVTDISSRIQIFSSPGKFLTKWASLGATSGLFDRPRGVAVDHAGDKVFVVDSWNDRIQVFRQDGQFRFEWGEYVDPPAGNYNFHHPNGVVVYDNEVYIADSGNNDRIMVFDLDGHFARSWGGTGTSNGKFNTPTGIVVHNSKVYVADLGNNRIQVFALNGSHLASWTTYDPGSGAVAFLKPWGIAIDQGRIYVSEYWGHRIVVLDLNGNYLDSWGAYGTGDNQFNRPAGIAVDGARGIVYVADSMNDRVQAFSPTGQYLTTLGGVGSEPGMILNPLFVALNQDGDVYVSEEQGNNRIQVFKPVSVAPGLAKAILLSGGGPYAGNHLWDATQMNANFAYRALLYQGFTEDTIHYLSADTDLDLDGDGYPDVDGDATNENLESALKTWASNADSLVLYLVGHGGNGIYRTSATETLSAALLGQWLNQADSTISGRITVVYDACGSGSFLLSLAGGSEGSRIVTTSTGPDESADFVSQGSMSYSNHFWAHVFSGRDIRTAFEDAVEAMAGSTLGEHLHQHPMLDADGDAQGNEANDLALAEGVYIGNGTLINPDAPQIGAVSADQIISGETSASLYASGVTDSDGIARVWGVIKPPDYGQGTSDNPVQDFPTIEFLPDPNETGLYEGTYNGFHIEGSYYILIYARDRFGHTSIPVSTTVSVNNPLRRRAIVVAGGTPSQASKSSAQLAYQTLRFQGYADNDIYIMSNVVLAGWDAASSTDNLIGAIETWVGAGAQDLVLYLVGEGRAGRFEMAAGDDLLPSELDGLLDALQTSLPGPVTVIYDASYGGSFMPLLIPPANKKRILIFSTAGDQTANFVADGDVSFSRVFWNQIVNGATVWQGFVRAKDAIWYASGQEAQLDDTGNGIGNEAEDGGLARSYTIGVGIILAGDDPVVGATVSGEVLNGTPSAAIWAEDVTTTGTLQSVFALITTPSHGDWLLGNQDAPLPKVPMTYDAMDERYEGIYEDFTTYGTYSIAIYAQDTDGKLSLTKNATVTQLNGPDVYEDDDTHPAAKAIIVQHGLDEMYQAFTQTHTFHDAGDVDWVKFYGIGGQGYQIAVENVGSRCNPVLTLYHSDGTSQIVSRNGGGWGEDESLSWSCPTDDVYLLDVRQTDEAVFGEDTRYDLKVFLPIAGIPGKLWGFVLNELGEGIGNAGIRFNVNAAMIPAWCMNSGYYQTVLPSGTWPVSVEATGYTFAEGGMVTVLSGNETFAPLFLASSAPELPGDVDEDGDVDGSDLAHLALEFESCSVGCHADFEPDGDVDINDLAALAQEFGVAP